MFLTVLASNVLEVTEGFFTESRYSHLQREVEGPHTEVEGHREKALQRTEDSSEAQRGMMLDCHEIEFNRGP